MRRHPALVPLSRDHHHVLVIAQRLRRATARDVGDAATAFLAHWEGDERRHFRLEEELVLPAYAVHGDPRHPAVLQMLEDHMLIRRDAAALAVEPTLSGCHQLGERLAAHVRLEEQELFPLVEATVPEPELEVLGDRLLRCEDRADPPVGPR